jgi:hypothetical protein
MWCVAVLTRHYIRTMEDVLALYEKPYNAAEPVVCLDEKPASLHREIRPPNTDQARLSRKTRQRTQTLRYCECIWRCGAESRSAFHSSHRESLWLAVCSSNTSPGAMLRLALSIWSWTSLTRIARGP